MIFKKVQKHLKLSNMKTIFFLIFFTVLGTATAQTQLYDPKELKEDADQYFTFLSTTHPDKYYFCSPDEFNKLKESIYSELNKPLSKADFLLTMAPINSCLDMHSTIPVHDALMEMFVKSLINKMKETTLWRDSFDTISFQDITTLDSLYAFLKEKNIDKDSIKNAISVLPPVEVRENELYFGGDSINKITEINGVSTKTMLSEANKYINKKLNPETNSDLINQYINAMIIGKYHVNPPFRIKFEKNNREETMNGVAFTEWQTEFSNVVLSSIDKYINETPYTYEIYPANSIAIFHIQTFDIKLREDFLKQLEELKKKVNEQDIKYIFYDLSMNGGGNHFGSEALDIIKHGTVYLKYRKTSRIVTGFKNKKIKQVVSHPNRNDSNIPDDRILFVLQSALTASGADYFCRIVSENQLGVLVGEPTGELTKTFSYAREFTMPYTGIHYNMATTLVDYSDYFKSLTTSPDIYYNLKNIKEFTEQELLNIINCYKNKKTCTN